MKRSRQRFSLQTPRWMARGWRRTRAVLAGGTWSNQVPKATRASLRWLLFDGMLAGAGNIIIQTYQEIYLLALGASRSQVGMLGAISHLTLPLAMLPGAALANRAKSHKRLVVLAAFLGTLLLLGLVWLPQIPTSISPITLGIGFLTLYYFFMYLLNPAWTATIGVTVPLQWRGRYFSTRNIFMGLAALVAILSVGQIADHLGAPAGYQVAFGIAIVLKLSATYTFSRIKEPRRSWRKAARAPGSLWEQLRGNPGFLAFCATAALWNFGIQISGPFFNLYLVEELHASATAVGLVGAAASLAALPGQRIFGLWSDRKGAPWVQRLTGFIIPLVPLVWSLMTHPWHAYLVNAVSGFVWAGYNLAAFNLLLDMTPAEQRPTFVAVYQTVVGLGMSGGALLGGQVAQTQGYRAVFMLSAGLRLLGAALFALVVARTRPLPQLPKPRLPRPHWPFRRARTSEPRQRRRLLCPFKRLAARRRPGDKSPPSQQPKGEADDR